MGEIHFDNEFFLISTMEEDDRVENGIIFKKSLNKTAKEIVDLYRIKEAYQAIIDRNQY